MRDDVNRESKNRESGGTARMASADLSGTALVSSAGDGVSLSRTRCRSKGRRSLACESRRSAETLCYAVCVCQPVAGGLPATAGGPPASPNGGKELLRRDAATSTRDVCATREQDSQAQPFNE